MGSTVILTGTYLAGSSDPGCTAVITDPLSSDLTYLNCSGGISCFDSSGVVNWDLGPVTTGQTGSVTLTAVINTCDANFITDQKTIIYTAPPVTMVSNAVTFTVACLTNTPTITPTSTATPTITPTFSPTSTFTATPTGTITPLFSPIPTGSLNSTDLFTINKNIFKPALDGSVSMYVGYSKYPGDFSMMVYNTAGEAITQLVPPQKVTTAVAQSYFWDGKNKDGQACASGVYLIYLVEPYDRKLRRLILLR
jgi:hypothetical protein